MFSEKDERQKTRVNRMKIKRIAPVRMCIKEQLRKPKQTVLFLKGFEKRIVFLILSEWSVVRNASTEFSYTVSEFL